MTDSTMRLIQKDYPLSMGNRSNCVLWIYKSQFIIRSRFAGSRRGRPTARRGFATNSAAGQFLSESTKWAPMSALMPARWPRGAIVTSPASLLLLRIGLFCLRFESHLLFSHRAQMPNMKIPSRFTPLGKKGNFLGIESRISSYGTSRIVILPVPYERTVS